VFLFHFISFFHADSLIQNLLLKPALNPRLIIQPFGERRLNPAFRRV